MGMSQYSSSCLNFRPAVSIFGTHFSSSCSNFRLDVSFFMCQYSSSCLIFYLVVSFFVQMFSTSSGREILVPPPQCDPNTIEDAPYQLQNICRALSKIYRLQSMDSYFDELQPEQLQYLRSAGSNSDVKRKDLDHVFLRFGKRR
ncbi:hypothetical protein V9T40_006830 [Parthenolecanium corni]|uniref:Uncharacterized protein n=1 Tax=Parthenolecanium corni TaxID=536013 RepID=A0AAN9Y8C5_9HEMI